MPGDSDVFCIDLAFESRHGIGQLVERIEDHHQIGHPVNDLLGIMCPPKQPPKSLVWIGVSAVAGVPVSHSPAEADGVPADGFRTFPAQRRPQSGCDQSLAIFGEPRHRILSRVRCISWFDLPGR